MGKLFQQSVLTRLTVMACKPQHSNVMINADQKRHPKIEVINPTDGNHTATAIFLHGSGDKGESFKEWILMIKKNFSFPQIKLIFPTAPSQPYTPLNGEMSNVWFNRLKISPKCVEVDESIHQMGEELKKIVDNEIENGTPINRIIVGGFSMGGTMALHLAFRYLPNVAGVFVMSSFLNEHSAVYSALSSKKQDYLPPVFFAHGELDILVPLEWGQETFKRLQQLGVQGKFHIIRNTYHELKKSEIYLLHDWISDIIPDI